MKLSPQWWQWSKHPLLASNPILARLYWAQTINLVGDALTWLGLALLAFELAGNQAGTVLAVALTLRVTAFVVLSPIAGVIADRADRKSLMVITHLARMIIVCLLPFVTQVWQIYAIVLLLNSFYAFFAPTYTATIPLVTTPQTHGQAIALSSATYNLLGVLGPGMAGGMAAWVGTRSIFFWDGLTFLIAAALILTLPGKLVASQQQANPLLAAQALPPRTMAQTLQDIRSGTVCLFADVPMRYALVLQLVTSIAGAEILVNTVGYVQGQLHLGKLEYGGAMAAFGIGATIAAIGLGNVSRKFRKTVWMTIGAGVTAAALLPANGASWGGLLLLWAVAGLGQTIVNVSAQTLIADRTSREIQGRVYGAHFAWSHLWWAFAYPLAGWMGSHFPHANFFVSSLIGAGLLLVAYLMVAPGKQEGASEGLWHEHLHEHPNSAHGHSHGASGHGSAVHSHLHFHDAYALSAHDATP